MTEQVKRLLEYQEADFAVEKAEKKVKSSKERKAANLNKQRYEVAVEERKKLVSARDAAEKEMKNIAVEVDKLVALANADRAANIPDDRSAISKLISEIDKLMSSLKKLEDKIKKFDVAIIENEKRINEFAAIATKAKEDFNINKIEYDKLLQQAKPEIDRLKAVRDGLQKDVDAALLNKYTNLRKNKIVPTAPLQNSRCGGCHMEMPSFTVSNAIKNGYCECENCGRIIYVE